MKVRTNISTLLLIAPCVVSAASFDCNKTSRADEKNHLFKSSVKRTGHGYGSKIPLAERSCREYGGRPAGLAEKTSGLRF